MANKKNTTNGRTTCEERVTQNITDYIPQRDSKNQEEVEALISAVGKDLRNGKHHLATYLLTRGATRFGTGLAALYVIDHADEFLKGDNMLMAPCLINEMRKIMNGTCAAAYGIFWDDYWTSRLPRFGKYGSNYTIDTVYGPTTTEMSDLLLEVKKIGVTHLSDMAKLVLRFMTDEPHEYPEGERWMASECLKALHEFYRELPDLDSTTKNIIFARLMQAAGKISLADYYAFLGTNSISFTKKFEPYMERDTTEMFDTIFAGLPLEPLEGQYVLWDINEATLRCSEILYRKWEPVEMETLVGLDEYIGRHNEWCKHHGFPVISLLCRLGMVASLAGRFLKENRTMEITSSMPYEIIDILAGKQGTDINIEEYKAYDEYFKYDEAHRDELWGMLKGGDRD